MTLFLRDQRNRTIIDIDIWNEHEYNNRNEVIRRYTEISVSVNIFNYSMKLFQLIEGTDYSSEFVINYINNIEYLSQLRGWLWEQFYMTGDNDGSHKDNIIEEVNDMLNDVAKKYDLIVVRD